MDIGLLSAGSLCCDLHDMEGTNLDLGSLLLPRSFHQQCDRTNRVGRERGNVSFGRHRLRDVLDLAVGTDWSFALDASDRLPGSLGSVFPSLPCF